jgi:hypothetical protein
MNTTYAKSFKKEFITEHPQHEEEVNDLYELMLSEIEEGGSETNEVELFISACNDLLV